MIESLIFSKDSQYKNDQEYISGNKKEKKEKKEKFDNAFWFKFGFNFAKHITKPILEGYGALEHPKPLSALQNNNKKGEIVRDRETYKILSPEGGGPTKEEIYASALDLAKKLGWKEKSSVKTEEEFETKETINKSEKKEKPVYSTENGIPIFITNKLRHDLKSFNISDEEIDKLKPVEAWDLLQQKTLVKEIKEPKELKQYKINELEKDFFIIQNIWEEAYKKMDNVNEDSRTSEILYLTGKTFDDPKPLEIYLQTESQDLKPEEKFFIEMSIQIKKLRGKIKELLIDNELIDDTSVSKEDFQKFVDTNEVSEKNLQNIAKKIMEGKQISVEEISIYSEKSKDIERIIKAIEEVEV